MNLKFEKYHGAGNDFIIVNGFYENIDLSKDQINYLCHRRFGIGADGLIILEKTNGFDFRMRYYNSDGQEATMCGNGGRCIARFAFDNNFAGKEMCFLAADGPHFAKIIDDEIVSLSMADVTEVMEYEDGYFLDTGSPHFVKIVENLNSIDVNLSGRTLADDKRFSPERTNVNFLEIGKDNIKIATFERGVEHETYACGTGVVAASVVLFYTKKIKVLPVNLIAKGGLLSVYFDKIDNKYVNIKLSGHAKFVFEGVANV